MNTGPALCGPLKAELPGNIWFQAADGGCRVHFWPVRVDGGALGESVRFLSLKSAPTVTLTIDTTLSAISEPGDKKHKKGV